MLNIVPRNRAFHLIQLCCQLLRQGRLFAGLVAVLLLATPFSSVQAANNAAPYGTQTVPANMVVGEVYQIVIPMRNTGTVPWTVAGNYSLVLQSPAGWNVTQISVGTTIGVNVIKSFVASVTAPSTPGVYNFQWCMDQNGAQFGTCSTPVAINVASRVQDAQFYATSMTSQLVSPTRVISVSMKNTGNVPWKAGQYSMGTSDTTWGITKLTLSANVPPNGVGAFSGTITAPEPGTYKMQWQMRDPDGNSFGAPSTALDVAVAGGPPTLDVRSPTPSQPFIGNANVILVPIHAEATPTGIATISKVWVEVVNPNSHTYDVLATTNGAILDQTLRLGAYPITLVFAATDSFNKTVTKSVSIVALNDVAQITAMDFPTSMVPGQRYNISITAKNSGGTTWDPKTTRLVPYNATQTANWGDFSLPLSEPVPPGGTAVFSTIVTAPAKEGTVGFQMIMNEATRANFGGVAGRSVTVAHPPPTVEMTAPVNRDSVDIPANTKAQVHVQGSATPGLGASITKLELLNNNTTVLLTLSNTATVDQLVELPAGVHQLRLRATDNWNKVTYGAIATYTVLSNNATATLQVVQATMQAGKSYSTTVTMQNSGTKPWTAAAGYALVSRHPEQWGIARVAPTTAVGAGGAYTFSVPVTAPSVAGTYDYQWSMVQDGVEAFGEPSKIVRVVVNPVAPSVPGLVAPDAGAKFVAVGTKADVRVQGSASAGEGATVSKLEVLDGATVIATANAGTIDATVQLAGGAHALRLRATDNFNQVTTGTVVTTVTVLVNGASAMSRNVPTPMVGGNSYPVTVVMRNIGNSTWTPGDGYVLAPVAGNPNWVAAPIPVPAAVAPGTDATFAFNVTAPADPATYPFQWKMSQNGNEFGTASLVVNVAVTGLPPKVALSAPLDGTVYTAANGSSQFTVQGSASATGSATISQFTLLDNGVARINGAGNAFDKVVELTPGKHVLQLRATDSRGAVTLSNTSTVNVLHNDASLSAPSVPATLFAGQRYTLAIVVKNTGDTSWQPVSAPGQGGVALAELPNNGGVWRPDGRVQLNKAVAPGETYTFNFDVVAPAKAGTYGFQWRMSDEGKELFGTQITTSIVVAQAPVPTATLTASPVNQRVAPGQMGSIALTGRASEASGKLSKLEVFVDSGSGYAASPVKTVSGSTSQLDLNDSISLPSGSYRLKLRATDDGGRYADSTPVAVNVTDSPLLGLVSGVRSSGGQQLQLVGWTCRDMSSEALSYQVYINAPANLGGTPVASGVANVGSELDDAAIQQTCHTPGVSHHFVVDLASLLTQYPGVPLYVSASSTHGERIVLPCEDHGCRIPDGMRIGLTSPNVNNLDRFRLPIPVFARAVVSGFTGTLDEVSFNINGEWLPATAEGGGAYSVTKAGLPSNSAPYVVYAKVRHGETTLITDEHLFYIDPGITPGDVRPKDGTVVGLGQPTVLSVAVNSLVQAGQSVKFFINPKAAARAVQGTRGMAKMAKLALAMPSGDSGSVVGDATFDGTKWNYSWQPVKEGKFTAVAKLLDGSGIVLMETSAVTLTVSANADPASSAPLSVSIEPPHLSNSDAGTLPGNLAVGNDGAATYSIELVVPPGTARLQPHLSLEYSSLGNNGVAGLGWTLSGLSTIQRCPKTIAQDGKAGRISFDTADRLCVDGQRLVLANLPLTEDNYWAVNAEYRTEINDFSRITRLPNQGFKIESKDGRISYYGTSSQSAMIGPGRGQVVVWALDRVEDRNGNYLTAEYTHDANTGEFFPIQLRYGGNSVANQSSDLAVRFAYEKRPDEQLRYIGGGRSDLHYRLTNIRSYIGTGADGDGGKLVRDHALHYRESAVTGRSLVDWMQACAVNPTSGVSECLPKTTFDWGAGSALAWKQVPVAPFKLPYLGSVPTGDRGYQGDFDGSGRTSFFTTQQSGATVTPGALSIRLPDGREIVRQLDLTGLTYPVMNKILIGDLDGDGRDDLYVNAGTLMGGAYCLTVPLSDGTIDFNCHPMPSGVMVDTMADLRNDKRMHLVSSLSTTSMTDCYLSNGAMQCDSLPTGGDVPPVNPTHVDGSAPDPHGINRVIMIPVDLSAQSMSDFYRLFASVEGNHIVGHVNVCLNQTQGIVCQNIFDVPEVTNEGPYLSTISNVGDMNNDGIPDIVFSIQTQGANRILPTGNGSSGVLAIDRTVSRVICFGTENGADCRQDPGFAPYAFVPGDLRSYTDKLSEFDRSKIGDFVGDGINRILFVVKPNTPGTAGARSVMCRYAYTGSVCQEFEYSGAFGEGTKQVYLDNSGVPALLYTTDGYLWTAFTLAGPAEQDKMIGVSNGLGHREEVSYARGDDAEVYSRFVVNQGVEQRPVYPQVVSNPGVLAKELRQDNGQGVWLRHRYRFEGALSDAFGRGELGFGKVQVTDLQSGLRTVSVFSQAYPFVGKVVSSTVSTTPLTPGVTGEPIVTSLMETRMGRKDLSLGNGATIVFPYVAGSTETRKDLDGSDLGVTTIAGDGTPEVQYDDWGNLLSSVTISVGSAVTPGASFTTKTVNTYFPADTTHWQVGLVKTTVVAKAQSTSSAAPIVRTVAFTYETDNSGQVHSTTVEPDDIKLRVTTTLDRSGNLFGLVNGKTITWRDPASNTDLSRTDLMTYDAHGRFLSTQMNAVGHKEMFSFDAATGAITSVTGPNLLPPTTWEVDGFGRINVETQPNGNQIRHYRKACQGDCPLGAVVANITDVVHGGARVVVPAVTYIDSMGHTVQSRTWGFDGKTIVTDWRYDGSGRLYEVDRPRFMDDPAYLNRRHQYDALNRVTGITTFDDDGVEHLATTSYNGLVITSVNANQQSRTDYRDVLGRTEQTKDSRAKFTTFTYDAFGNLLTATDPMKHQTVIAFDRLGRRISLDDPDLGLLQYVVDPLGQVLSVSTPNQRELSKPLTTFKFDSLGRLTERAEPDLISHWIFDKQPEATGCSMTHSCGKLVETYTGSSAKKDYQRLHTYDALGRASTTTQLLSDGLYAETIAYDDWGRVVTQSALRGTDTAATKDFGLRYNANGYLERIQRGTLVLWHAIAQDATMQPTQLMLGNGLTQTRLYKPQTGRLYNAELQTTSQLLRLHESYTYDPLGNVLSRGQYWDTNGYQESFTYDELNRLKTSDVLGKNNKQTFIYDDAGSILSKTGVGTRTGEDALYHYPDAGHRPARGVDFIPGVGKFDYDSNGNLIGGAGRTLEWSSFDMPTLITKMGLKGLVSSAFTYGPEHQRTGQTRQDGSKIVYAGRQEVELDPAGQAVSIKTYWPNGVGVEIDHGAGATDLYWTHVDRLGSPVALSDSTGLLQEPLAYDAWGKRRTLDGGTVGGTATPDSIDSRIDNKGFTGHEMLDELDLVHMNGRIYDPYIGRVMSGDPLVQDPLNGQSYNRYSYVQNNPTNVTDPTGFYGIDSIVASVGVSGHPLASDQTIDNAAQVVRTSQQGGRVQDPVVGRSQTQQPSSARNTIKSAIKGYVGAKTGMPTATDPALEAFSKGLITGEVDNVMDPDYKSMKSGVDLHEKIGAASDIAGVVLPILKWIKGLFATQIAFAPVEKFSAYIFKEGADHGKDAVFRGLGYDASHSAQLAKTWETQAAEKFARGEYTLKGAPNEFGQRINIGIELPGIGQSAGKTGNLNSGWMLRDNGTITLNTPFSGFTK